MYCGEWIESHALHVFMLHAPDFLGFESAWTMAREHREMVEAGLRIKKMGNELLRVVGGRADPSGQRPGRRLLPRPEQGGARRRSSPGSRRLAIWQARRCAGSRGCPSPSSSRTTSSSRCALPTATRSRTASSSPTGASRSSPASTPITSSSSRSSTRPRCTRGCATVAATSSGRWHATRSTRPSSPRLPARPQGRRASATGAPTHSRASSCGRSRSSTPSTRRSA